MAVCGGSSIGHHDGLAIWPSPLLVVFAAVGLFIAHALVVAGDAERRVIATYPAYFDAAWKHGVQLALSFLFVGLFWVVLELGAGLFKLIDLDFLRRLIEHRWFALPATTLALACALHVTDARAGIVRGIRVLVLTLLSWLLPLMALFGLGFLASLPFTGLTPLWGTRFATALLLSAAATLICLVNATYQDGAAEHAPPRALRYAGSLAALLPAPLVAIAAYALALRVIQHGWTSDRIIATACLVVGACYAVGYAWAVLRPGPWLARIAGCNIATAFVILAVLLALFTPIADPARLAVASQLARLEAGTIAPDKFDFAFLRFDGARYGRAALEKLKAVEQGRTSRRHPAARSRRARGKKPLGPASARCRRRRSLRANLTVYPAGRQLPDSFLKQNWAAEPGVPSCLLSATATPKCDAIVIDIDGDGKDEILILEPWRLVVMADDDHGGWRYAGQLDGPVGCAPVRDALHAGRFEVLSPRWRDLQVEGWRLRFVGRPDNPRCP